MGINIYSLPNDNWKKDAQYVYIGRAGRGMSGYFGNPFPLNGGDRGSTLQKFEVYARKRIEDDPEYREAVKGLKDKILVCFCKPHACHGDILEMLSQELNEEEK